MSPTGVVKRSYGFSLPCYWLQVKWASHEESDRSVFGHALGFERSVTLFILNIKVSGLFTQLRALFSGCE